MRAWVLMLVVTGASAAKAEHFVTATFFQRNELRTNTSGSVLGPALGWTWLPHRNFGLGAGARLGLLQRSLRSNVEGYVRGVVSVPVKVWQPLLGVEVGFTAAWGELRAVTTPSPQIHDELNSDGPLYVAMHTELLRFVFSRFLISALGLQVGTSLPSASALRVQFDFLTVGVRL